MCSASTRSAATCRSLTTEECFEFDFLDTVDGVRSGGAGRAAESFSRRTSEHQVSRERQ